MLKRLLLIFSIVVVLLVALAAVLIYQFTETRQLAGIVRDSETHQPLEGVILSAENARAETDDAGHYVLTFARGNLQIAANLDGYVPVQHQVMGADPLTRAFTLDVELTPNVVAGYVLDADTNQVLTNAAMQVGERTLTTNAQGAYEARGVKKGTPISAQFSGFQPNTAVYAGEQYLNIALVPTIVNISIVDLAGQPIANALVQVGDLSGSTDGQGRVVLRRVNPGELLRVTAAGHESATARLTASDVRLAMRPNVLDAVVKDATTGRPISDTLVYLGNTIITTDVNGAFHLDNVPPKAIISIKSPGYTKTRIEFGDTSRREVKLQPFHVKGIHIPFGSLPENVRANLDLIKTTELNAIVIDVKAENGRVGWDSQVPLARQINAPYLKGIDLTEFVERCRTENIYCIARMPVFQDTLLATTRPDLGLRFPGGRVFADNNGSGWTDAGNPAVWDYNIALAKEAAALGFDEIQFDYVRFPGYVSGLYSGTLNTEEGRVAAISGFMARAQKELRPSGVFVSADVFGLTAATDDDQYTGQRLRDLGSFVDYISPMVYPDVWPGAAYLLTNGLGISNCTEAVRCPYDVIYNSYKRSAEKTKAKVRLWLQAYVGRGNYGVAQYKVQKQAAQEAGSVGWMFWSGIGNYDPKIFNTK